MLNRQITLALAVAGEMRAAPNSALAKVAVQAIGDRDIARACASTKKGAR